ncbi:hypothetical protein ACLOAV_003768 [Pseudogymnoascus australis]
MYTIRAAKSPNLDPMNAVQASKVVKAARNTRSLLSAYHQYHDKSPLLSRMVNLGRSHGCHTCKKRRVKCDEGTPLCQRCLSGGHECQGYQQKPSTFKFKFKPYAVPADVRPHGSKPCRSPSTSILHIPGRASFIPPSLQLSNDFVALSFFLTCCADSGRSATSTRGFFEALPVALAVERPDSAVSTAITAVSTRLLAMWKGDVVCFTSPHQPLLHAIVRLRAAVHDESERKSHATPLAALVLQFYENLSAVLTLRKAMRTHYDGAVALFLAQEPDENNMTLRDSLLRSILHQEVSYAIRSKQYFPLGTQDWLAQNRALDNPSSMLDIIGVHVANIQHSFFQDSSRENHSPEMPQQGVEFLLPDIDAVEARLASWVLVVPSHWHPLALEHLGDRCPSIVTYLGDCDIYPSIQVATIWNTWRCYRLILLNMKLAILCSSPQVIMDAGPPNQGSSNAYADTMRLAQDALQECVDAICRSLPYHLGNRTAPSLLFALTDLTIAQPSYYYVEPENKRYVEYRESDDYMSSSAHKAHVIFQGPWHMVMTLSSLLNICSGGRGGSFKDSSLRKGQLEWIQQQFVRK